MEKFLLATTILFAAILIDAAPSDVDSVCDGLCDCNHQNGKLIVTCHDRGFDHVPDGIPKDVTTL